MKACSYLPAATKMIYTIGLQDLLYGVNFECPPEAADTTAISNFPPQLGPGGGIPNAPKHFA